MNSDLNQTLVCDGPAYVLGVDAGGTRTRAVLADASDGRVLGEGVSGPGNALTVPVSVVTEHLVEAIGEAVRGVAPGRVVAVAGGFAGAASVRVDGVGGEGRGSVRGSGVEGESRGVSVRGSGAEEELGGASGRGKGVGEESGGASEGGNDVVRGSGGASAGGDGGEGRSSGTSEVGGGALGESGGTAVDGSGADEEPGRLRARAALTAALERLGIPLPAITIHSDIEAAFAGAPGHPAAGLALIAGTGSVAARVQDRVLVATSGGDGWLLGDDGSGFWIGRRAVRAALRAADGRGRPTSLVAAVGRALGVPEGVLPPRGWERVPSADGGVGGVLPSAGETGVRPGPVCRCRGRGTLTRPRRGMSWGGESERQVRRRRVGRGRVLCGTYRWVVLRGARLGRKPR
ncbi:BadF/BadG/BcrA/BcrD ATPase family protein [Streptomyces acidiscabies]|uniref:BadF/BadG/BcrA/BcrD ATPase family protein n=1 Tax=Streptomyces acidiscabies TaxID=42234 RepID=UPI002FF1F9E3